MSARRDPRAVDPVSLVAALVCGVALGIGLGWLVHGHAAPPATALGGGSPPGGLAPRGLAPVAPPAPTPSQPAAPAPAPAPPELAAEPALARALERAVRASAGEGRLQAAVMLDVAPEPLLRPAGAVPSMRAWSMIKAVTALTVLEHPSAAADPTLRPYVGRALRRSDNCAQRKLSLELERRLGSPEAVHDAIRHTLARARGTINVAEAQRDVDGAPECAAPGYPGRLAPADASAPVVLLGTSRWRADDAVRFVHALRAGIYGAAASGEILRLMGADKLRSQEIGAPATLSAAASWGAGEVFRSPCWRVAYKAGWGGSRQGSFLAGQMGTVELPGGRWAAFSVMFHPAAQPATDDPGRAHADRVIERALTLLKGVLRREFGACP